MKQVNKIKNIVLFILVATVLLTGCAGKQQNGPIDQEKLQVVTTLFPYYDFVRQIAGDQVEATLVVPAGMDSHSFEPTPADIKRIQQSDLLICNGGEMEHWLYEVLESMDTSHMTIVTMMDYVETMEEDEHEEHEEPEEEHDHGAHDSIHGYDEHIWTSPVIVGKLVAVIEEALVQQQPEAEEQYRNRLEEYQEKLHTLDAAFRQVCGGSKGNLIVVGDQFPFRYLAEEYGLDYRAAFSGCSSDTEPSAKIIANLIDTVSENQLSVVYYLERSSNRTAQIIAEETGAKTLMLHSCHKITRAQFESGTTYLQLMEENLENLKEGLCQ